MTMETAASGFSPAIAKENMFSMSLLSFGEKVGVRLVSRKWKQAVDWMFGRQSSVRIVLRPIVCLLMEDCGWKSEQMCDHTFDPGYDFCFTHPG